MANVIGTTSEAERIQSQMRELRADLRDDVQEIVVSAHEMADVANYVRAYPWLCVGAAVAAGYLIVPQRMVTLRPDAEALIELARKHQLVVQTPEASEKKKRGGLLGQLVSLAGAALLQGGLKMATNQLTQAMASAGPAHSNGRAGGVAP